MATISSIVAKLTLNTTEFSTGFQRAKKKARSASAAIGKSVKVAGAVAAAGAAAAVGGLTAIVQTQRGVIDSMGKTADAMGITTQALAGLRVAANRNDVSMESLAKAFGKTSIMVGDLKSGVPAAVKAFDRLGLTYQDLEGKSPDQQFGLISDRLNAIGDTASRASAASDIFGNSYLKIANVVRLGSEGIKAANEEAERLGTSLTRIDVAKVENANDALDRVRERFTGISQQLTVAVAPALEALANRMINLGPDSEKSTALITMAFEKFATGAAYVSDSVSLISAGFNALQTVATGAIAGIVAVLAGLDRAFVSVANALGGDFQTSEFIQTYADELSQAYDEQEKQTEAAWDQFVNQTSSKKVKEFFAEIAEESKANAEAAAKSAEERVKAAEAAGEEAIALSKSAEAATEAAEAIKEQQDQENRESPSLTSASGLIRAGSAQAQALANAAAREAQILLTETQKQTRHLAAIAQSVRGGVVRVNEVSI